MKINFIFVIMGLAGLLSAQVNSDRQQRILKLENSLLAPCCWAEPVSRHRSDIALQMRAEIANFVSEGRSDREILDFYKQKYTSRILVEPEGEKWWWMHIVPIIVLALGVVGVVLLLRKWLRPQPAS
ncbi:MAG: cytochrome c-type biogenesis protein CcmH [Acidobacteria bacterium]|nr:cytochrome c-type biogenesis protein CcmH [Acidobacteriota bacterium]